MRRTPTPLRAGLRAWDAHRPGASPGVQVRIPPHTCTITAFGAVQVKRRRPFAVPSLRSGLRLRVTQQYMTSNLETLEKHRDSVPSP